MAAHRYWRLHFTSSQSGNYVTIGEVEMRVSSNGVDQTGSGTASADSTYSSYAASRAFANDGVDHFTACWESSGTSFPHWLKYDFGAGNEKEIMQYTIQASTQLINETPRAWTFQYSDNNVDWTTVDTRADISWSLTEQKMFTFAESAIQEPILYISGYFFRLPDGHYCNTLNANQSSTIARLGL